MSRVRITLALVGCLLARVSLDPAWGAEPAAAMAAARGPESSELAEASEASEAAESVERAEEPRTADAPTTKVTVRADLPGKPISSELFGIFFEDLNYAADGGLYAELVQNRSFEYTSSVRREWNGLTAWSLVERGSGQGAVAVETEAPLHENNRHYAALTIESAGGGVGLRNEGFGGIAIRGGEIYDVSLFARQIDGSSGPIRVRLEGKEGQTLGEAELARPAADWGKLTGAIAARSTVSDAWLVVLASAEGRLALDMISLFPRKTFRGRPNGLRADLAQVIADLKPRFVRFPGGCLVHGDGLENMYRWKDTIGPVEQRRGQRNIWRYYQSVGLGYFEYFQFCEDIGAKPLPVVPAGVCCQNSGAHTTGRWGEGQKGLPMGDMPAYVEEVLDLIEYANGPASSEWGAKRAAAGHPEPFGLRYLGVGNEDRITPVFEERFRMIYRAVKARHPEITVIGTVGPFHAGEDFDAGWKIADRLGLEMVDEHYYEKPEWFLANTRRYDAYDRRRSKVYLGEYAAHERGRRTTLRSALAEAAFMTGLERNGDVVRMASYAPLLGKVGSTQWNPDLIYFTNTAVSPTINYHVQRLFGRHQGDRYLETTVEGASPSATPFVSSVRDSASGDLILKLVNPTGAGVPLHVEIAGMEGGEREARRILLTGPPTAVNRIGDPEPLVPETSSIRVGASFEHELPPHSLTVIRARGGDGATAAAHGTNPGVERESATIREAYEDHFAIGMAGDIPGRYSDEEMRLVREHFGVVTPENCMKPALVHPREESWRFQRTDALVEWCEAHEIGVHGHTLVWHAQTNDWFFRGGDKDVVTQRMKDHIHTLVGRYKGRIRSWDVVNEAIRDGGNARTARTENLRDSQWLRAMGPGFLTLAFRFAHEADPEAKLYYNDYGIESGPKHESSMVLLRRLLEEGAPVHGVGIQGHWSTGRIPYDAIDRAIADYASLGLEVSITELDVTIRGASGGQFGRGFGGRRSRRSSPPSPEDLEAQARAYARLFSIFLRHREVLERVTFWGLSDRRTWRFGQHPLIFDSRNQRKPAYAAILDVAARAGPPGESG